MPIRLRQRLAGLVLFLALACSSSLAAAEIVIIESTAPGLDAGSMIGADEIVTVPEGAWIVIVEPDGSSRTIEGPYEAAIGAAGAITGGGDLIAGLSKLVAERENEQQILGALRAAPGQIAERVFVVDVARSRTTCVPANQPLVLWRPTTMAVEAETRIETGGGESAVLLWPEGEQELDWPPLLIPGDGEHYLVRLDTAPRPAVIEFRLIPVAITSDAERAVWMLNAGCRRQAERLVDQLADGNIVVD